MEYFKVSQQGTNLHVEGFPDAVKAVKIDGPLAKRLADLALHKSDLVFADNCLDAINVSPVEPHVIREALWRSAVVHFIKCFGDSGARFQLSSGKIFKEDPPEALIAFDYFKNLRNKHFIHDENSYAQSHPGAILNNGSKAYKVEKVVCFSAIMDTLGQEYYGNLKLLIQRTLTWADNEFDKVCNTLTAELEAESYESLLKRETVTYTVPSYADLKANRNTNK